MTSEDNSLGRSRVSDNRWRVALIIGAGVAAVVLIATWYFTVQRNQNANSAHITHPTMPTTAPGGKNTSESYRVLVDARNRRAADEARKVEGSAVVTIVGAADHTKKPPLVIPSTKVKTYTPPKKPDPVVTDEPVRPPDILGTEEAAEPVVASADMKAYMAKIMASWNPGGHSDHYENVAAANPATGTSSTGGTGTPLGTNARGTPLIRAGSTTYASLDMTLDTDIGGPVRATILQGTYKGSTLLGTFKLLKLAKQLTVQFSTLITAAGETLPITAILIDPKLSLSAMRSEVDNHYLVKFALPLGAAFLAGFGTPTTSIAFTPVGGVAGQNDDTSNTQRGLAAVGYTALELLKDQAARPPTVRLFAGTGIGILFQTDVYPPPTQLARQTAP